MEGTTTLGTGAVDSNGQATLTTSTLSVGGHTITASYGGDSNYTSSISAQFTETIGVGFVSVGPVGWTDPPTPPAVERDTANEAIGFPDEWPPLGPETAR